MSEDAYFSLEHWRLSKPATKLSILAAAAEERTGFIRLVRFDRDQGKMVTDIITADMPADEIIL